MAECATKSPRKDGYEIMASVQVAMVAGLPYTALRDAIFTHPTLLEGVNSLFADVPPALAAKLQRAP